MANRVAATANASRKKYQARPSEASAEEVGGSSVMPCGKILTVSYSPPRRRRVNAVPGAHRGIAGKRSKGSPKMKPRMAPAQADAGSATQIGARNSWSRYPERACRQQAGVAQRYQAGKAGEQHQRHGADDGQEDLVGDVEEDWLGDQGQEQKQDADTAKPNFCVRVSSSNRFVVGSAQVTAVDGMGVDHSPSSSSPAAEQAPGSHHEHRQQDDEGHDVRRAADRRIGSTALRRWQRWPSRRTPPPGCRGRRRAPPGKPSGPA